MKVALSVLLLALSLPAAAQTAASIYQRACGPKNASFHVELVKGQPPAKPEPGKALVYFIHDTSRPLFTTRVGLDGAWREAIQRDSYLFASVAPGEHHACAMWQRGVRTVWKPTPQFVHFTAEAGKVYYYLTRTITGGAGTGTFATMGFGPADRDEALFLIASDPQSIATPKP